MTAFVDNNNNTYIDNNDYLVDENEINFVEAIKDLDNKKSDYAAVIDSNSNNNDCNDNNDSKLDDHADNIDPCDVLVCENNHNNNNNNNDKVSVIFPSSKSHTIRFDNAEFDTYGPSNASDGINNDNDAFIINSNADKEDLRYKNNYINTTTNREILSLRT